jgi:hypothetical protein
LRALGIAPRVATVTARLLVLAQDDGLDHRGDSVALRGEHVAVQRPTTDQANHRLQRTRSAITLGTT